MEEQEIALVMSYQHAVVDRREKHVRGVTRTLKLLLPGERDVVPTLAHELNDLKRDIMVRVERRHLSYAAFAASRSSIAVLCW